MERLFCGITTLLALLSVWVAGVLLAPAESGAFVGGRGPLAGNLPHQAETPVFQNRHYAASSAADGPAGVARNTMGVTGLLGFGMCFGASLAILRGASSRTPSQRVSVQAQGSDIEVAEKTETKPVSYLQNLPRSIIEKKTLDKMLSTLPKDQWDNPPEESYLYTLKMYAETYGEGKAT
eukprot:CAMPEP_0168396292 /NCGR_PEP_ID=MMETSP0228-20121227/20476_1 /TAXON_ID=133427 /ORGANISM="Protoceratium reticulatum, Strain CCCM 535 (=CCMP 1889)" /LENGTH=178 /DNA_ID=CAMNT_0008409735 /DNA_START=40 /DNA_END=572 /DNA_ORIENTATION=+